MCTEEALQQKKEPALFRLRHREGFGHWTGKDSHCGVYFPHSGIVHHFWEDQLHNETFEVTMSLKGDEALERLRDHYKIEWVG